jgi:hypothetical protein
MSKKPKSKNNQAGDVEKIQTPIRPGPNHLQALQFIDGCVARAPLGRNEHIQVQKALSQISGAISELEQLKKGKQ